MRIYQKIAVAAAGAALSLVVIEATPADAATITYDFTVDVTRGSLAGNQYSGFFSYDDTSISPGPSTLLPYFDVTEFNFQFADQTYTRNNLRFDCRQISTCVPLTITGGEIITDLSTRPFTFLIPRGGTLSNFQFGNVSMMGFPNSTSQPLFQLFANPANSFFVYQLPGEGFAIPGSGSVTYAVRPQAVPESDTVLGIGVLGFFGWFLKKKKAFSKQLRLTVGTSRIRQ